VIRIPDYIIYGLALIIVLGSIFGSNPREDAPEAEPPPFEVAAPEIPMGPELGAPSPFDERVVVEIDEPSDGIGTAFAVGERGVWVTARHVVEGCRRVGLEVGRGAVAPVKAVEIASYADLAVLRTGRAPTPLPLGLPDTLRVGTRGFHVGYPQGQEGEVVSQLLGRSTLVTRGQASREELILTWAETGRTRGLIGSLGGMSGGPVFDAAGRVIGVTLAESPRRGRIYTADPSLISRLLQDEVLASAPNPVGPFDSLNYGQEADRLRRERAVVKVVCRVTE
jgi:S1-C subfamily serine protease